MKTTFTITFNKTLPKHMTPDQIKKRQKLDRWLKTHNYDRKRLVPA